MTLSPFSIHIKWQVLFILITTSALSTIYASNKSQKKSSLELVASSSPTSKNQVFFGNAIMTQEREPQDLDNLDDISNDLKDFTEEKKKKAKSRLKALGNKLLLLMGCPVPTVKRASLKDSTFQQGTFKPLCCRAKEKEKWKAVCPNNCSPKEWKRCGNNGNTGALCYLLICLLAGTFSIVKEVVPGTKNANISTLHKNVCNATCINNTGFINEDCIGPYIQAYDSYELYQTFATTLLQSMTHAYEESISATNCSSEAKTWLLEEAGSDTTCIKEGEIYKQEENSFSFTQIPHKQTWLCGSFSSLVEGTYWSSENPSHLMEFSQSKPSGTFPSKTSTFSNYTSPIDQSEEVMSGLFSTERTLLILNAAHTYWNGFMVFNPLYSYTDPLDIVQVAGLLSGYIGKAPFTAMGMFFFYLSEVDWDPMRFAEIKTFFSVDKIGISLCQKTSIGSTGYINALESSNDLCNILSHIKFQLTLGVAHYEQYEQYNNSCIDSYYTPALEAEYLYAKEILASGILQCDGKGFIKNLKDSYYFDLSFLKANLLVSVLFVYSLSGLSSIVQLYYPTAPWGGRVTIRRSIKSEKNEEFDRLKLQEMKGNIKTQSICPSILSVLGIVITVVWNYYL